jgi:hypothetical protein
MPPGAPRYDSRILDAVLALDDRSVPIAETCRRVAEVADRLGIPRPSYVHLRRVILAERALDDADAERRAELRAIAADVIHALLRGRFVHPYEVADRVHRANET